jgi:hypothetical protein
MEVPQNGWYNMENPKIKWIRTGGTLILGNPHIRNMFMMNKTYHDIIRLSLFGGDVWRLKRL